MKKSILFTILGAMAACAFAVAAYCDGPRPNRPVDPDKAKQGYEFLQQLPVGPKRMELSDLDNLYLAWDGDDADKAKNATPEQRRKLAYARYGFVDAPYENYGLPMGLVYKPTTKDVHLNCLLCHSGAIRGMTLSGLPNQRLDLATFAEDLVVLGKVKQGQPPPPRPIKNIDYFSRTRGGSNVWIADANLLNGRTPDLEPVTPAPPPGPWQNFDTTPSPYWNIKKKFRLYHAGFISFGARPPMLAVLDDTSLTANQLKALLPDFENVANWLDSVPAPKYPGPINQNLAAQGQAAFERVCAGCHGTYGKTWTFPNADIPIATIGTDAVDLNGKGNFIENYHASWFNKFGAVDPSESLQRQSYLAPPLDGIWASPPYLHNGAVPTLYHILHPDQRPAVWKVIDYEGYDDHRVGLLVDQFDAVPVSPSMTASDHRRYFDTSIYGQSNAGHLFSDQLNEDEKTAVLEYLKTL
jgi:hypothetical protein